MILFYFINYNFLEGAPSFTPWHGRSHSGSSVNDLNLFLYENLKIEEVRHEGRVIQCGSLDCVTCRVKLPFT